MRPVARAFDEGAAVSQMWENAATFAAGLRVPKPYGDAIILKILRDSGGVALAQTDDQILASILDWAQNEGIFLSPGGSSSHGGLRPFTGDRVSEADAIAWCSSIPEPASSTPMSPAKP